MPPKRKRSVAKSSRSRKSKVELFDEPQDESIPLTWWSSSEERAIIRFRNGNIYEGNISMKVMHGEGCFKWADGTIYSGYFKDNEMNGRGLIQWKDDTWYEGEFAGNLRHGKGLYVDSRNQRFYIGQWSSGSKHGEGIIHYSRTFKNTYDGQWVYNVRHGFGSREYCPLSGYEGEWDFYVREGKGLMMWPNHDWLNGQRHGCGTLDFGLGLGAHYSGEFKNNRKHGAGILVSNNGYILQNKQLFQDDNLRAFASENTSEERKGFMLKNNCLVQNQIPYWQMPSENLWTKMFCLEYVNKKDDL
ncbi:unnamed protein product, partial [Iphiclides podalirius]